MKKIFTLATGAVVAALLGASLPANAQPRLNPVGRPVFTPPLAGSLLTADEGPEAKVLLEEDFSLFTAGTEAQPDAKNLSDNVTGEIPSIYTHTPGWYGAAVRQAGGVCAVMLGKFTEDGQSYTELPGYLITPVGNYAGNITVAFRARLADGQELEGDLMTVSLQDNSGELEKQTVEVGTSWKTCEAHFTKGGFSGCILQLSMAKGAVLLDDIKVTSVATSIIPPVATAATDYTADGFTANWQPTDEAESYLLSVYETDISKSTVTEGFDGIRRTADGKVDASSPNYPEGWTIVLGQGNGVQLADEGLDGSQALVLGETNDWLQTPRFDAPVIDFKFFAKNISADPVNASTLKVNVMIENGGKEEWYNLGQIDIERISTEGEYISIANNLTGEIRQINMVFEKNANDEGKEPMVAIDQVSYMTQLDGTPLFTDREVKATSYKVTGIKTGVDYVYTVKARNAEFTSASSNTVPVLDLLPPALDKAADVSEDGYTARWQPVDKADGYYVRNFRVYTVPETKETVLLEEDFDKVTSGSESMPNSLYNWFSPSSLDDYTATAGWLGQNNTTIAGMMGCDAGGFIGSPGLIQTPAMNLSGNGGKFTVTITACGGMGSEGDSLVVQAGTSVYKKAKLAGEYEPVEVKLEFDNGEADMALLLYSNTGQMLFIDDIKVSQVVEAGSQVITEEGNGYTFGDVTSYTFDGLEQGDDETFGYRVYAYRLFCGQEVYSLSDRMELVDLTDESSGVDRVEADGTSVYVAGRSLHVVSAGEQRVVVYTLDGRAVVDTEARAGRNVYTLPQPGVYVVKAGGHVAKVMAR